LLYRYTPTTKTTAGGRSAANSHLKKKGAGGWRQKTVPYIWVWSPLKRRL
jgi:hypothetical protein